MDEQTRQDIWQKINRETGKIRWDELREHHESGALVLVDPSLDLVDVALQFAIDNKHQVEAWLKAELVDRVPADFTPEAGDLAYFWAAVVAPWVLIQPEKSNTN